MLTLRVRPAIIWQKQSTLFLKHLQCNSMHSRKHVRVHNIDQWEGILTMAKRKTPYKVTRLQYSDFYNLKGFVTATDSNKSNDTDGQSVNWHKVCCLCFKIQLGWQPIRFSFLQVQSSR